jgi:hypothetical protein
MKRIKLCLTWVGLLLVHAAFAQTFTPLTIEVETETGLLSNPWGGGLNCPQLSEADLNRDGLNDLYLFDRTAHLHLAYRRQGNQYVFAPELVQNFPELTEWSMLRDYNGDGISDIIAYSDVPGIDGVTAYTGFWQDNKLAFKRYPFKGPFNLAYFPLKSGGKAQVYITRIDIPSIEDVDCDSDLDILTFNISGGYIEFYQNQSVEKGYGRDSMIFALQTSCWGGIYEDGLSANMNLAAAPGQCFQSNGTSVDFRHAGSTLTTTDVDNDGDVDLFVGDVSFNNINLLTNGGTCKQAWFNKQDPRFPGNDKGVDLPIFPAVYMVDVNADGKKEVLVAPNENNSSEDVNVLWLYENGGTSKSPEFKFKQDNFLVKDMIDLGTGAYPAFVDYNADGLMDLVVGNGARFLPQGQRSIGLHLFQNVGTAQKPKYRLVDRDWLGMNQYNRENFALAPTFGDMDGDQDLDVIVGAEFGQLYYAENTAGPGKTMRFGLWQAKYMGIDIGQGAIPQIVDVNGDKLPDIVLGNRRGNISYFQNTGTVQKAAFTAPDNAAPNIQRLGKVDGTAEGNFIGYSAPLFFRQNQSLRLLLGTEHGELRLYDNIDNNLAGTFNMSDNKLGGMRLGGRTKADLADINGDGFLDMVVGNARGGLSLYSTTFRSSQTTAVREPLANRALNLVPNPASDWVSIPGLSEEEGILTVFDMAGRQLMQQNINRYTNEIQIRDWMPGVYVFRLSTEGKVFSGKLVKRGE